MRHIPTVIALLAINGIFLVRSILGSIYWMITDAAYALYERIGRKAKE